MANPEIALKINNADPTLATLLDLHKKDIMLSLNCHALGTIESFNMVLQTVTATINYKKTTFEKLADGTVKTIFTDYPLIIDCPAVVLCGGKVSLQLPIKKGDTCLIIFNDRAIDNWMQSGQVTPLSSPRLHSFSDGIALVGIRPLNHPLDGFQADGGGIVHSNGTAVRVKDNGKIKIENIATTLNTVLNNLVTAIKTITVDVSAVAPNGGTISASSQLALTSVASQIAGLLE